MMKTWMGSTTRIFIKLDRLSKRKTPQKQRKMSYRPSRTQYAFELSAAKFLSRTDLLKRKRAWETFERTENYNDIICQRFSVGDRSQTYYQFVDQAERNDYRYGQQLHISRYPWLPASTFDSISSRLMPDVAVRVAAPNYTFSPSPLAPTAAAIPESVATDNAADMTIYTYVSSFNSVHYFKYNFVSDEERLAYHRGERLVRLAELGLRM